MATSSSRRKFLQSVSLATAAATLPLTEKAFASAPAAAVPPSVVPYELFTAADLAGKMKALQARPGNDNLFQPKELPFTIVLTTETAHSAKEFEWHEGRDHILQILEGTTVYELGGTPQGTHGNNGKAGEYLAPASEGAKIMTLNRGDMLVIPRNTPHKRTTDGSVTFYLISTTGNV